ncbi:hypothetical protein BKA58DRAFT_445714 [Alternaria rosae]|uniref:uncharacterized protein n=1 Tax=Alternaria rosae TaxID=1187941 RepID=UPI001E8E42C0|nr:uncharacterized protein BKA58DRAFT_445714 [Alternaria rosae]KAH6881527.1 hypothetical protein BKA58DRAFT_445714 [Alternaria rosae]
MATKQNRGSPVERSDREAGESKAVIERLCANEASEILILKGTEIEPVDTSPPVMLMKVSYELAQKVQAQISTGLAYRHERNMSMSKLDNDLRTDGLVQKSIDIRFQGIQKPDEGHGPTPQECALAKRLEQEAHNTNLEIRLTEQKKKTLSRDVELARKTWEDTAMTVVDALQGIFARCGLFDDAGGVNRPAVVQQVDESRATSGCLVVPQLDERKGSKLSPEENQATQKAVNDGSMSTNQAVIIVRVAKARREKREAQREHDEHRNTFRRGLLAARVAAAADRPDAPNRLIEEEFSRDYVRAGNKLTEAVTHAEAAHEAQLAAAAEAAVSIIGSDDDMEPNFPYDLEEYAAVKKKCLDRDAVQERIEAFEASSKPNLRPLGYLLHMAQKWQRAAEADDDVSSSGEESVSIAGVEPRREMTQMQDSVLKPASKSKSWHTEPYWSFSDCAEGKKRRRIDD